MFKINLKSAGKKINYKPLSLTLKYLIDDGKLGKSIPSLEKIFNCKLSELQKKNFLSPEGGRIRVTKAAGKPDALILQKIKIDEKFNSDYFRNNLAGFIIEHSKEQVSNLHIFIPSYQPVKKHFISEEYYYQTFVEGILLGNYSFDNYKSKKSKQKSLDIYFYSENEKKLKSAIQNAIFVMQGVYTARDLQNEPANNLTPEMLASQAKVLAKKYKLKATVFNEREIRTKRMGGLLSVGSGSFNKPRFIVLEYKPSGKATKGKKNKLSKIALVGKGVTFDTGGISLKPSKQMDEMKADMSGAAVVIGTLIAASLYKLNVHLFGIIPAAENMPSGESFRPGDIIITSSGRSIEVEDTDAEGRLILADALEYASKLKPNQIIDLATLTGACVVALGEFTAGLFTKNDLMADKLFKSGMKTYDRIWRMPMWDDFNELIESDIADVANLGKTRWAGAITAAKFLENFVDKNIPWAHLDIAGPAIKNNSRNYTRKYMTGFGVRLLTDYLANKI